jgi:hypothetical protein
MSHLLAGCCTLVASGMSFFAWQKGGHENFATLVACLLALVATGMNFAAAWKKRPLTT